jgi:cyclomaltodextrin glucanotransferase
MSRFQSLNSDPLLLRLAVILLMTSRGIPCIYYGTEQLLHNDTNGGNDPYNRPMMEKWDIEEPIYRDLKLFSKFRRINPAVSLGSQLEKYITDDIYCYTRRYRDSRCFVAMNKGNAVTINIESTDIEDGEYRCSITGRFFEITNGKLLGLSLGSKEAIVLNYIGERVKAKTIVRAQLNGFASHLGQIIAVTGDCPELGNWDINKAYILEYINKNTWFGEIPFDESVGKAITYKYIVLQNGGLPIYENVVGRRWILANEGIVRWQDNWSY